MHLLYLFGSETLALGCLLLLLLQIEIQCVLIQLDLKSVDVEEFFVSFGIFGGLVQRDEVLARCNSQREILPLLVGLERIFLPVVLVGEEHDSVDDGIALDILGDTFDRS